MKDLEKIEIFLLSARYKRLGLWVIMLGLPVVLLLATLLVFTLSDGTFPGFWDEWGLFLLHIPLSVGMYLTLFSKEKEEDEMYQILRLKALMHGVRFVFVAILFLPVLSNVSTYWFDRQLSLPDVGGNLAVVTLLLLYSNAVYYHFKRQLAN